MHTENWDIRAIAFGLFRQKVMPDPRQVFGRDELLKTALVSSLVHRGELLVTIDISEACREGEETEYNTPDTLIVT